MGGLYAYLGLGSRAFLAFQNGIASAGHNLTNASTPGFRRTRVEFQAEGTFPDLGGVRSDAMTRVDDPLLSRREREASASFGMAEDLAMAVGTLEGATITENLHEGLSAFFATLTEASAAPTDGPVRQRVVAEATALVDSFGRISDAIDRSIQGADDRIRIHADTASRLTAELATLNSELQTSSDPTLLDRRDLTIQKLGELVGGYALIGDDQKTRYLLEDGTVLVDERSGNQLVATYDPALGVSALQVVDGDRVDDVTIVNGRIAGQIDLRDRIAPDLRNEVDQLAFDFATDFNAIHQGFAGQDGITGRNFFVPPSSVAGAAADLSVDPTISQDPGIIAGADSSLGIGDNAGFLALSALSEGHYIGRSIDTFANLGGEVVAARQAEGFQNARAESYAAMRDSLSGVSVEEEMTRLTEYQRSAQAAIEFVQTVDGLLGHLLQEL